MANAAPAGSDVSGGAYRCTSCGYELSVQSVQSLAALPGPFQRQLDNHYRSVMRPGIPQPSALHLVGGSRG